MKTTVLAVALALCACGPSVTGEVSGYALHATDSLFVIGTDSNGAAIGAYIVLSDQTDTCSALAATKAPGNATVMELAFQRRVDGKDLVPDVGEYTVGATGASVSTAGGVFIHTDANGTDAIPANNSAATSGLLKITAYDSNTLTGSFDGKFGQQNDPVTTAFTAGVCQLSTDSFAHGFLGAAAGPSDNGGSVSIGGQHGSCSVSTNGSLTACVEYVGSSYASANLSAQCTSTNDATWSSTGCPKGMGYCTMNGGTATEYRETFGSTFTDPASLCQQNGGVFTDN